MKETINAMYTSYKKSKCQWNAKNNNAIVTKKIVLKKYHHKCCKYSFVGIFMFWGRVSTFPVSNDQHHQDT